MREEEIGPTVIKALEVAIRKGTVSYTIKKSSQNQNRGSELDVLYKNLDRLSFKEERAKEAYIDGIDTKEEYKANKLRLQKERQELQEMINTIECSNSDTISNDSRMLSSISDVLDIIKSDKFTIQEKNAALKSIVDQITYDKKTNHIDVDYYLIEAPETL